MLDIPAVIVPTQQSRYRGCLLGGAIGDALGAPIEFMRLPEIEARFGPSGVTDFLPCYGGVGRITDDTQMTLFTAEGLLRGYVRGCYKGISSLTGTTAHAYVRWLKTQGEATTLPLLPAREPQGWLFSQQALHERRAPGLTCLASIRAMTSFGEPAQNDSKGCGAVMRVAPVGLFAASLRKPPDFEDTFTLAAEIGAITHGHPTGFLTAGVFTVLIEALVRGKSLVEAIGLAKACLIRRPNHEETLNAMNTAEKLAVSKPPKKLAISKLGVGWVAEEALAISIYCALIALDFEDGVLHAINHDGDSDSTGAMTGNLLGAAMGIEAIPMRWQEEVELRDVINSMSDDLLEFPTWEIGEYSPPTKISDAIWEKYPGS